MFAMDGPMVMKVAPLGIFFSIHCPASRPPGTPPVPATKAPDVAGVMIWMLESRSESAIIPTVVVLINALLIRMREKEISSGHHLASARPANTAIGGAIGSRY